MTDLLVLLSVYDRLATLPSTLAYYNAIECVSEVRVIWHDPLREVPAWVPAFQPSTNSLNNRFLPEAAAGYGVALHTDDDVLLDKDVICDTYSLWLTNQTPVYVFDPRFIKYKNGRYNWSAACQIKKYNTGFVTKGSIFSTSYLSAYFDDKWATIRRYVSDLITGEDLLMSAVLQPQKIIAVDAKSVGKVRTQNVPLNIRTSRGRRLVMLAIGKILQSPLPESTSVYYGSPLRLGNITKHCKVY